MITWLMVCIINSAADKSILVILDLDSAAYNQELDDKIMKNEITNERSST